MIIDGTFIVSGKHAVHVEFNADLAYLEYLHAVEDLENVGAVVIPHDSGYITNGDPQVEKDYRAIEDSLNLAQWDLENSEKDSSDWIEARDAVEAFKAELKEYLTLDNGDHFVIVDREKYKKHCGSYPDLESVERLIDWYRAFAANECVQIAIIPLSGEDLEDWESRITNLDYDYLESVGGALIPVPEICLLDREVIKILNDNGYHVKDNAKFLEVA